MDNNYLRNTAHNHKTDKTIQLSLVFKRAQSKIIVSDPIISPPHRA